MSNNALVLFLSLCLVTLGCSKNQSFDEAIELERQSGVDMVSKVGKGLPRFIEKTLTPTWDNPTNIVRLPKFQFLDQRAQVVTEADFKDKNTVVAFFFSSCAGFCPMLVSKLKKMEKVVGDMNFVLITVDPEVDTPAVLAEFAQNHKIVKPNWKLLTGSKDHIYKMIRDQFASEVKQLDSNSMRKFAHTEHFYFFNGQGELRAVLNGGDVKLNDKATDVAAAL